jgi:hypothetical protein
MELPVGLYPQPNEWTCGPFALKHALVALGCLTDEDDISSVAHPHWAAGTDEIKLARAARAFDCELPVIRKTDAERARLALVRHVEARVPVLLCIDDWGHWVTVVRHEADRFVVLDSMDGPVLQVLGWPELKNRWRFVDDDGAGKTLFDLLPVKPRFRVTAKAQFSVDRAFFLRRPENADLALHWDEYLGDLLEICRPRTSRAQQVLSMAEFLRRHQEILVNRVSYWHGDLARDEVERVLKNFRFVAETYGLVIPIPSARRALADLAILLGLWSAARRGVDAMYGSENRGRLRLRAGARAWKRTAARRRIRGA